MTADIINGAINAFTEGDNHFYTVDVISCDNIIRIVNKAKEGDKHANMMVLLCNDALSKVQTKRITCLCCDEQFGEGLRTPYAFVFLRRDDMRGPCLLQALCKLHFELPRLQERIMSKYEDLFMCDVKWVDSYLGHA